MDTTDFWKDIFAKKVSESIRELLEQKYLYQNVLVDIEPLRKLISPETMRLVRQSGSAGSATYYEKSLKEGLAKCQQATWEFDTVKPDLNDALAGLIQKLDNFFVQVPLPTIKVTCNQCNSILPPHNPGYGHISEQRRSHVFQMTPEPTQLFEVSYQCQSCKGEPVVFLIHRRGLKLTMVGRSQMAAVDVPKFIPNEILKLFRNSIVAQRTGFILAAALYLRCAIENYMRSAIAAKERLTGDELAELYAQSLSKDFSDNFPSLKKAYSDLSLMLHNGLETDAEFQIYSGVKDAIEGHFEGLDIFKRRKIKK
jgi:hypothetical protein